MNKSELKWTATEEGNFPAVPSTDSLGQWKESSSQIPVVTFEDVYEGLPKSLRTDYKSFLVAGQHRLGLNPAIKRHRKLSQQTPDIKPRVNPNLAPYLQDVERYNPEFMRHVKTEVHASLPDVQAIEEEKRIENQRNSISWRHGLILKDHLGFSGRIESI